MKMKRSKNRYILASQEFDEDREFEIDEIRKEIYFDIYSQIDSILDNYAVVAHSDFPEYDPEWCDNDGNSREAEALEAAESDLAHAVLDVLFKYAE